MRYIRLFRIEQLQSGPNCDAQAGVYPIFYAVLYLTTFRFTPPLLMILIRLATFRNIHRLRVRVYPNAPTIVTTVY